MKSSISIAAVTPLSKEIAQGVKELQRMVQSKFEDQYMANLGGITWEPHLTFIQTTVYPDTLDQSLQTIKQVLQSMPQPKMHIEKLVIEVGRETDYIFFTLDQQTFDTLLTIRNTILESIKDLRKDAIPLKYQKKWDALTNEERSFLLETGHKYRFEPHISITKLSKEESKEAYEFILPKAKELFGKDFYATKAILQKEDATSEKRWRDLEAFELKA